MLCGCSSNLLRSCHADGAKDPSHHITSFSMQVCAVPGAKFSTETRPERIKLILATANLCQLLSLIVR